MAVPGMKKDDFVIDLDGNMLTIRSEKEENENKEEKDKNSPGRYTISLHSAQFYLTRRNK